MENIKSTASSKKSRLSSVSTAAFILIGSTILGQLLGLLRTKLVNANFPLVGVNSTDAYFAAFNIPDLLFFTLSAGALGVAFIPILTDKYNNSTRRAMWELSDSLMNLLSVIMLIIGILIVIFAHPLIEYVVAPHLPPDEINTAASIMQYLAFNPLLFTLSGILTSVQQTMGRFFFYAIAPLFYNASIILSIYLFRHNIGLVGLGIGAMIGAIVQLLIVFIGLYKTNFYWRPKILWRSSDFRQVLRNLPARSIDQGIDQIEDIVETHIASGLGAGAISNFANAYTLSTAPILLVGTTIATAAFPRLNLRLSQKRPDLFRQDFRRILRTMIWISIPVCFVTYYCRGYLARLIYTRGDDDISIILGFLTFAIFSRIMYSIISRWFYSYKDNKTPLFVSLFVIALNIVLAVFLAQRSEFGIAGLAIAQSIVGISEVLILVFIMIKRDPKMFNFNFIKKLFRIGIASIFTGIAGYLMVQVYPLELKDKGVIVLGGKLALITGVIFLAHILSSAAFRLEEVEPFLKSIKKFVLKPIKIQY